LDYRTKKDQKKSKGTTKPLMANLEHYLASFPGPHPASHHLQYR